MPGRAAAALLAVALMWSACYDFTLPSEDDGAGATGGGAAGTGSGGGPTAGPTSTGGMTVATTGGGGEGGTAGAGGYPAPCDQYPCDGCVACMVAFYDADPRDCEDYVACRDACLGDAVCEADCAADRSEGFFIHQAIGAECTGICGGRPPCS